MSSPPAVPHPVPQAAPRIAYVGGWATHRHVGDDAILRAHLAALRDALPGARPVVLGLDPDVLRQRFEVDTAPDLRAHLLAPDPAGLVPDRQLMLRRLGSLIAAAEGRGVAPGDPGVAGTLALLGSVDALVDLGAGSLTSAHRDVLWSQAAAVSVTAAQGVPVLVSGVGLGPIDDELDAVVLGRLLRSATLVTVRDRAGSAQLARRLGVSEVLEGPDDVIVPGAAAASGDVSAPGLRAALGDSPFVCLAASASSAPALAPAVAMLYAEHGLRTVAFAMDFYPGSPDLPALRALRDALPNPDALEVLDPVPPDDALRLLVGRAQLALGSRFHLAVFAAAAGTPAVLVHHDEYTSAKAHGLASLTGGVKPVAVAEGRAALLGAVARALTAPRPAPLTRKDQLPAVTWLRDLLAASPAVDHRSPVPA
jgi:colanic acid/amylovoran biosynthesis protein